MNNIISLFSRESSKAPFEAVLSPHIEFLYQQAYHYTGTVADAEDLLQDLLVELFTKQDKMQSSSNLGAWLNRCLYNRFVDRYRQTKRFAAHQDIDEPNVAVQLRTRDSQQPESECYYQQIREGLNQLNSVQHAVVSLHDICGFSLPELVGITDMPLGTLKSHLHRARKQLKKNLNLQPFEAPGRQLAMEVEQ